MTKTTLKHVDENKTKIIKIVQFPIFIENCQKKERKRKSKRK